MEAEIKKFLYGNGDGSGYGNGDGNGNGSGNGSGYGDGNGDGNGSGSGSGDGNRYKIKMFKSCKVYYVDNIPCVFKSVHSNFASVEIINKDFSTTKAFLGKFENCIAHGDTIRKAIEDARSKYYQSLDFEEVKEKLLAEFKNKGKLTVKELYDWHGILTGSCRFGRSQFQQEHNLKDDDLLSLEEFVKLTGSAFGGDKINALI